MSRPRVTPHQPPCRRGADAQLGGCFASIAIRKKKFPPAKKKDGSATSDRDTTPHARQPSCRPRAMRAGSARLQGQTWRGSSVPTSAWPNRHGRAGDRLERPTLCPAPSTPLTISRWSGSRQQAMLSSSRRVRAARPWKWSRAWILSELSCSSRARATRFATLGASAREA